MKGKRCHRNMGNIWEETSTNLAKAVSNKPKQNNPFGGGVRGWRVLPYLYLYTSDFAS